jgi:SAM-dependent methyltransferase
MADSSERQARLARAWDDAAEGYDAYFVPRFAPWVELAVAAIPADLPDGPILVPCCGTFPELDMLVERFPDRRIVGIDLSPGMIERARERAAGLPGVEAVVGDAATLDPHLAGKCGAVVSVFGLQQLPDPEHALRSWLDVLRPNGRLSIVFWPDVTETDGPFALLSDVVRAHLPADDETWEEALTSTLTEHDAILERDEFPAFPMTHRDAAAVFDACTLSGPLRTLLISRGEAFVHMLRAEFLRRAPAGEWRHRPRARLLLARR